MSRIGNKPIEIPEKVEINIDGNKINVKGPKGELVTEVLEEKIKFEISDNVLQFTRESDEKQVKSLHGLYRSLVANNIVGVSEGYSKTLTLQGVGHRVTLKGNDLEILCGFSHPDVFKKEENITLNVVHQLWIKPFNIPVSWKLALKNSQYGGLVTDDDYVEGTASSIANELSNETGKVVRTLGLDPRTAGFHPTVDNLPPTAEKIINKLKSIKNGI